MEGGIELRKYIYREIQKPRQIWIWLIIMIIAAIMWYGFIQQIVFRVPFGDKPAPDLMLIIIWLIFGIVFPLVLIFYIKLIVEVRKDGIYLRFLPFHLHYRVFLFDEIDDYEVSEYRAMDFGGYGIRENFKGEKAYSMEGKKAVRLLLKNNKKIVIGSQKSDELVNAIDSVTKGG